MAERAVTVQAGPGITLAGLLGVVFIVLKLTGVITWSWVWVLAPFWIPFVLALAALVVFGIVFVVATSLTKNKTRKRYKNGRL